MSDQRKEIIKMLADFGTIGMTMAFSIFIGLGIGYFLDHRVFGGKTAPWLTLIFMALGIVAAFKNLFMMAKRKDL
ncbi:MAG: AtpZ/AtpI family protein [Deltaproteobacteria bacterium]|jgi:ATP synthase protein I